MLNFTLCMVFLYLAGPTMGIALDSMLPVKENAPPKWIRIGIWCVCFFLILLLDRLWRASDQAVNFPYILLSLLTAAVSFRFFYAGSIWNKLLVFLILNVAIMSAELVSGLLLLTGRIGQISADYTQPDMLIATCAGAICSNTAMFLASAIWKRFHLKSKAAGGSCTFVLMTLLLSLPTVLVNLDIYISGRAVTLLHILSMAGAFFLNFIMICIQFDQTEKELAEKELAELKHQTRLEQLHYRHIVEQREELSKIRHDYNNYLTAILGLLRNREIRNAEQMIQELLHKIEATKEYPYCGIPVVNAILSEKESICRRNSIQLQTEFQLPDTISIASIDLCSIFSNLLDNAIRACTQLPLGQTGSIQLRCKMQGDYLIIHCQNPASGAPKRYPEGTGYGTRILKDIARRYDGKFQTEFSDGLFIARLVVLSPPDVRQSLRSEPADTL